MTDDPNITTKILHNIHAEMREMRSEMRDEIRTTNARIDVTNARLEALTEMTMARFTTVENALLDISARTHVLSGQFQRASARYDRELDETKVRLTKLEELEQT